MTKQHRMKTLGFMLLFLSAITNAATAAETQNSAGHFTDIKIVTSTPTHLEIEFGYYYSGAFGDDEVYASIGVANDFEEISGKQGYYFRTSYVAKLSRGTGRGRYSIGSDFEIPHNFQTGQIVMKMWRRHYRGDFSPYFLKEYIPLAHTWTKPVVPPSQEGIIVNQYSQKCIDVSGETGVKNGLPVQLWDCEYDSLGPKERWLKTDQVWTMDQDGFIFNRASHKCLDVRGDPGTQNGSALTIWDCEFDKKTTDQKWELTAEGFIKNTLSGKCLDVSGSPGTKNGSKLQLWDCERASDPNTDQKWWWVNAH